MLISSFLEDPMTHEIRIQNPVDIYQKIFAQKWFDENLMIVREAHLSPASSTMESHRRN